MIDDATPRTRPLTSASRIADQVKSIGTPFVRTTRMPDELLARGLTVALARAAA